ncbi:serine hydrolase domain-containing protein [Paenibacillus silvae]|uniref:serine hydrolase domain-containing protein n=1 Tax=Paenibacillus silvae TaxID=1325358 RepID=UPI002003C007|nr:serine hydrolase domain-containing protein [Paenibacillus silvae]MCK6073534.1 beta-lactamase family protein [Paenibacillus silvae]MCK6148990.1 beta-lactamase family protein [Paenibacillus silvae]MCK6267289.1 beta-lactamase family protein [Paenibacillus silvae]
MKRIITVLCAFMLVIMPVSGVKAQADEKQTIQGKAKQIAEMLVQHYGVTSLQYAIMDEGEIILSDGAGFHDKASQKAVHKDTMYGIGSVSKMVVTTAVMMLVDSGQVDLDQPLTTYITDFKMADSRYKEITPRMLMNHSSGLYGSQYGNSMLFDDNDTRNHDELLNKLQAERLKSKPGEYSVYCNDGFQLLEILVERVSGLSYSKYVERFISNPLQLDSTKTPLDSFNRDRLAETYWPTFKPKMPVENANIIGTGGFYSTAEELTQFAEVLMGNRPDLLSAASVKAMQSPEYRKGIWVSDEINSFNFGLGWDAVELAPFSEYGIKALTKGGDTIMYHASLITIPEHDISMAVLSSGGSSIFDQMFATKVLLEVLKEQGIIDNIKPDRTFSAPVQTKMPAELNDYSGLYGTVGATTEINIQNGAFTLPAMLGGLVAEQSYVYTGDGYFTSKDGSVKVSFVKERNAKTYVKVQGYLSLPGLGQMGMSTYDYQKMEHNNLDTVTQEKWSARNGLQYFALDEKITSIFYLVPSQLIKNFKVNAEQGYVNGTKITDVNHSVNVAEIPIMNGRDAFDLELMKKRDAEILTQNGQQYISEKSIRPIFGGKSGIATIPANGQARWYAIDGKSAEKTITVDSPEHGGYAVYDDQGQVLQFSIATGEQTTKLPKKGFIVFGGNAGDVFQIHQK